MTKLPWNQAVGKHMLRSGQNEYKQKCFQNILDKKNNSQFDFIILYIVVFGIKTKTKKQQN